jgi:hypothetical protein
MFVAKVQSLKEETVTFTEMKDIEELVINTMGVDTWLAILHFTQERIEELEDEIIYAKDDVNSGDSSLYALRAGVRDEIDVIENLITKVTNSKRLDRRYLIKELNGAIKRLIDNEGYI